MIKLNGTKGKKNYSIEILELVRDDTNKMQIRILVWQKEWSIFGKYDHYVVNEHGSFEKTIAGLDKAVQFVKNILNEAGILDDSATQKELILSDRIVEALLK